MANGSVSSVAVSGTAIYVGGSFTSIDSQTRNRLAAFQRKFDYNLDYAREIWRAEALPAAPAAAPGAS